MLLLIFSTASLVHAHTRVELGPYVVIVGWLEEPVIVGERNALIVDISEDDIPVEGVEATLDLELVYAGSSFRSNINPTEIPGFYTAEVFPTIRGQYNVRLFGNINGFEIDEIIAPEEVLPASRIQFPEPVPDAFELEARIDLLETELRSARLFSYFGIAIGLIGTVLGALGIRKK
ncbi:MAG: hypothetical protein AAF490_00845 [Chloroflexota bacterium]